MVGIVGHLGVSLLGLLYITLVIGGTIVVLVSLVKIARAMDRIADGIHKLAEKHDDRKREPEEIEGKK